VRHQRTTSDCLRNAVAADSTDDAQSAPSSGWHLVTVRRDKQLTSRVTRWRGDERFGKSEFESKDRNEPRALRFLLHNPKNSEAAAEKAKARKADLDRKIEDLHARVHRGAYRALPSRRHYIPKAGGQQRPLAIAALEDKIVQKAACAVLNAIYEEDFLGFSYGFRPKRSQHDALHSLPESTAQR
jgi:hypothetical protein